MSRNQNVDEVQLQQAKVFNYPADMTGIDLRARPRPIKSLGSQGDLSRGI
jgi:hypothetical protein